MRHQTDLHTLCDHFLSCLILCIKLNQGEWLELHVFYIFLISLANNIDNFGVRLAYSIRGIQIRFRINLWISVITFVISFCGAYFGDLFSHFLSNQAASDVSAIILVVIGLWIMMSPSFRQENRETIDNNESNWVADLLENPPKADSDCFKEMDFYEATLLGIALSFDNIGSGLGAGMIGLNSFYVGLFSAVISFLAIWFGNYVTEFIDKWNLGNKAIIVAGCSLILLGLKQVM
jgi:putative sporulation protein YtaF